MSLLHQFYLKKVLCVCYAFVALGFFCFPIIAQTGKNSDLLRFEFINQNIKDVLFSLSVYQKIPIVPDDTITGTVSFQYSGGDFQNAFDTFLRTNRLYVDKKDSVWTVTKIRVRKTENFLYDIDALDVSPSQIFEKISFVSEQTIVQDILPNSKISIHISNVSVQEALEIIMKPYSDYLVEKNERFIQIKKKSLNPTTPIVSAAGSVRIKETAGLFEVYGEKCKLSEVLDSLFGLGQREYSSFVKGDQVIEKIGFSGKSFEEGLSLILEQVNSEGIVANGLWYILPGQQSDVFKKIRNEGKNWYQFPLRHISFQNLQPFLSSRLGGITPIALPDGLGFLVQISDTEYSEIVEVLKSIDVPENKGVVKLRYLKTEELFKFLPPSVKRENLIDTGTDSTVFFVGSQEQLFLFKKDLEIIDRPKTRIRYDLLIIQYQESSNLRWGFSSNGRQMKPGDQTMIAGSLGNLLKLNFDVITVLGYQFAAQMDTALSENQAKIFADTTLYGLSGQDIKFNNTNTYRYRDYYIDSETQKTVYTGVTREITSGLILNINGWVSGDGMITTNVSASVSKRGADVSSTVGNPPPTSEKTITTQVRSRSGETVVLSGLRQNDSSLVEERVPFISKIPLLGWLFKSSTKSEEHSQMVIYLIPHVDAGNSSYTGDSKITESLFERFVAPYAEVNK